MNDLINFHYGNVEETCAHPYLWPVLQREIAALRLDDRRAFDVGCGNGATANILTQMGFDVTGIDPSEIGVGLATKAFPKIHAHVGSAYDDLRGTYGTFPLVISLEVIEHCFFPKKFARTCFDLLADNGVLILSTPYHGYLKNVALSVLGRWDLHANPFWEGGHIKFFSRRMMTELLANTGFVNVSYIRVGRIPPLAKSIIVIAHKRPFT